ncbi:MAG: hypothetical protein IKN49_06410 [Elusimicrobiaceae bacterium]|nr:hypothetical protein [Elusimicrobiaceae bacterium]
MSKYTFCGAMLLCLLAVNVTAQSASSKIPAVGEATYAETSNTSSDASQVAGPGVVSKSSLVTRIDMQLSDKILHANTLDYSEPDPLDNVAEKCLTSTPEECFFLYKTYENAPLAITAAQANLELSILSLPRGQVKQALAYIDRAAQLSPDDPFIELTRGWTLFAAGKYKKARKAFADMLYLTADFEYASSAKLGTALAYYFEGNARAAAKDFQYIYTSNPYLISLSVYMMGQIAASDKNSRQLAPVFLQQALSHDSHQYPALQKLAVLSEKDTKRPLASFQYYSTLYSLDPTNKKALKKLTRFAEKLNKSPEDYLFYLRLDQPIVQELVSVPSDTIKMALYADRWQNPVELQRFAVMPAGIMQVLDDRLGEVLQSPSYVTRILEFNPQTHSVDIKDPRGHVEFSARRPFTLKTTKEHKTLLVKDVRAEDVFAADYSDKELTGSLLVIPSSKGIRLVNQTSIEDLIPALLATQAQDIKEPEALRALAVVFRGALQQAIEQHQAEPYHITDNDVYFQFKGINLAVQSMIEATKDSRGLDLSGPELGYYADCGVVSYSTIGNTEQKPDYYYSPANLSKYMISNPPQDLYSTPTDPTKWSAIKWMYLYDAADIEARLNDRTQFGRLRALVPLKLSPQGRVLSMRFEGSKGEYISDNEQETLYILSAGTMRSSFFDFVPMYKGKNIARILVRGYDSGTGVGLCVAGAEGLARKGRDYQGIIKYYFPQARIVNTETGEVH